MLKEVWFYFMFKELSLMVLILMSLLLFLLSSCQFEKPNKKGHTRKDLYQIYCIHPTLGYKRFIVSKNTWNYPIYNNGNTWIFIDINGNKVVSSLGCYTDKSMKFKQISNKKNEK
tara:strand:- start:193 stop:537 length:345 start_codon:yes stop_codon:yes gene_type:complete